MYAHTHTSVSMAAAWPHTHTHKVRDQDIRLQKHLWVVTPVKSCKPAKVLWTLQAGFFLTDARPSTAIHLRTQSGLLVFICLRITWFRVSPAAPGVSRQAREGLRHKANVVQTKADAVRDNKTQVNHMKRFFSSPTLRTTRLGSRPGSRHRWTLLGDSLGF